MTRSLKAHPANEIADGDEDQAWYDLQLQQSQREIAHRSGLLQRNAVTISQKHPTKHESDGDEDHREYLQIKTTLVIRGPGNSLDDAESEKKRQVELPIGEESPQDGDPNRDTQSCQRCLEQRIGWRPHRTDHAHTSAIWTAQTNRCAHGIKRANRLAAVVAAQAGHDIGMIGTGHLPRDEIHAGGSTETRSVGPTTRVILRDLGNLGCRESSVVGQLVCPQELDEGRQAPLLPGCTQESSLGTDEIQKNQHHELRQDQLSSPAPGFSHQSIQPLQT